jgi:hypothetical protein
MESSLALHANIRLEWKSMEVANTLAYYNTATITVIKSFTVQAPGLRKNTRTRFCSAFSEHAHRLKIPGACSIKMYRHFVEINYWHEYDYYTMGLLHFHSIYKKILFAGHLKHSGFGPLLM